MILSGGAGTRLWPLSTLEEPKQFIDLLGGPLFTQALHRLDGVPGVAPPIVVTGEDHLGLVESAMALSGVEPAAVLTEPVGRNTGPACVAAAAVADPKTVLVVLPSDHLIQDVESFRQAVSVAVEFAISDKMVTFGVRPTRAETGYGYIQFGDDLNGAMEVVAFTEKPDAPAAAEYVSGGAHLWNSGMFVFRAGAFLEEARKHMPEVAAAVEGSVPHEGRVRRLGDRFLEAPAVSVDVGVMERTDAAVVVPLDVGWSDVGSWHSLWEEEAKDESDNVVIGDVVTEKVFGSYIRSASKKIAVAGLSDVVVVETADAILVVARDQAQLVRDLARKAAISDAD